VPLKERELIAKIRKMAGHPGETPGWRGVVVGIGDDCAILGVKPGHEVLVTTDFSLEGVHFRRDWLPARDIGRRCLVRGLSDIAAMGGQPTAAFLSLAVPRSTKQVWIDDFFEGLLELAKTYKVRLAGGDLAESAGGVLADIAVVGQAPKGQALLRSGAKPGDGIYVSVALGRAIEIEWFRRRRRRRGRTKYILWHDPRIELGIALRKIASACIDVSDGLSTDLSHICEESGVGAVIQQEAIPLVGGSRLELALHGGQDYELLFTSAKAVPEKIAGLKVTLIGEIVRGKKMELLDAAGKKRELPVSGWEHFREGRGPSTRAAKRRARSG